MSRGATFRVDLDALAGCAEQMAAYERRIEVELADLDALVDRLHLTWTGRAADAQRDAHRTWALGLEQMRVGLADVRRATERAHHAYDRAARTNAAMWAETS